jgi:5-methylcytosine-specific restriction protein A
MWPTVSRHKRGYGSDWDKRRKRILARDFGICQPCLKLGHTHRGSEVDHIVSRAEGNRLRWSVARIESDDNLQTICSEAHKIKTAAEQGRMLRPKQTIGLDGFPE